MKESNTQRAIRFLECVVAGKIDEAYEEYVDMAGKHHNAFFPAGFLSLRQGMKENHAQFPDKRLVVKNVLGDENLVAVHSHLVFKIGDPGTVVVHLFRFKNDRIVELWDCGQSIPANCPNTDGPF